jgi:protein-S-isoprenylcysteine O-methyltransferase Ste14
MMVNNIILRIFFALIVGGFGILMLVYTVVSRRRDPSPGMPRTPRLLTLVTAVVDRLFGAFCGLFGAWFVWKGEVPIQALGWERGIASEVTGMLLLAIWMAVGWWGILSLGEFVGARWSRLKEGHKIVKTGAYAYSRHPLYSSRIACYVGLWLFFGNFAFLLLFAVLFPLLYLQAKLEEGLLTEMFGEEYGEYKKEVGMLLPRVFKRKEASSPVVD